MNYVNSDFFRSGRIGDHCGVLLLLLLLSSCSSTRLNNLSVLQAVSNYYALSKFKGMDTNDHFVLNNSCTLFPIVAINQNSVKHISNNIS